MAISFRMFAGDDLELLVKWISRPHVQRWWRESAAMKSVKKKYGGRLIGDDPTTVFIILSDKKPIGMIQSYYINDYPEHARLIKLDHAVGVDLFIGELDFIGKGYGPAILSGFIKIIRHRYRKAECIVADPEVANMASIRSFKKAGFKKGDIVPGEHGPEQLMIYQINI